MIKKISALLLLSVFLVSNAFAHVMNSDNVYTDISYSEAKDDIVLLNALGIISYQYEEYIFRPHDPLAKQELASWVGSYFGLKGDTSEQLAEAAVAEGYLSSLIGIATYQDVNQAFFQSQLTLDNPNEALTREQFAQFVIANVDVEVNGQSLYNLSGFKTGPVGIVESVQQVEKLTSEGKTKKVYELTIDGEVYELGLHPRVVAQVQDPTVWVGMTVTNSSIGPNVETDEVGTHHSTQEDSVASENTISEYALQFIQLDSAINEHEPSTNETSNSKIVPGSMELELNQKHNNNSRMTIAAAVLILAATLIIVIYKRKKYTEQ